MINERKLTKDELAKREDIVQGMKQNKRTLVKKYGKDAEKVMYGRATKEATKEAKTTTENMDSKKASIRKMIEDALMVKEVSPFVLAADAARDAGEKEFEFPKGSGKMHPVTIKQDIKEDKFSNSVMNDLMQGVRNLAHTTGMSEQEAAEIACMEIEREFGLGDMNEDLDLGHQDNEPHMLKGDLYKIGKYAMELYQMMDSFEGQGEVDFPHWWQSKITTAKNMISGAKHYLDFEVKEPQIDAMVDAIDGENVINEAAGKFVVRPCSAKDTPWAVWQTSEDGENDKTIKGFKTKEDAKKFADEKNSMNENMSDKEEIALSKLKDSDQLKIKAVIDMIKKEKKSK